MNRTQAIVRWVGKPRRKLKGWLIFAGFILLNETRGLYVVAEFLKAYNG
jgi:hypothetical protein